MFRSSISELRRLAEAAKDDIISAAEDNDRVVMLFLHWTAGHYGQFFDSYHVNIDDNGGIYLAGDDLSKVRSHTWRRNSGAIGIALCCCCGATTEDLGDEPPTEEQIDTLARVIAALCEELGIPCDYDHVMTHAEAADEDGYGLNDDDPDCRWDLSKLSDDDDLGTGGDIIRGKALEYMTTEGK